MRRQLRALAGIVAALCLTAPGARAARPASLRTSLPGAGALRFEPTRAQDAFLARSAGGALVVRPTQMTLRVRDADGALADAFALQLVGARPTARLEGGAPLPGVVHDLRGRRPERWRVAVPGFARVRADAVYPGIDVVYYGRERRLEWDFEIAPGADPAAIRMAFPGARRLERTAEGDLLVHGARGALRVLRPVACQVQDGARTPIGVEFALGGDASAGFALAGYDRAQPLVIDPVLDVSHYLGGSGHDEGHAIAVDRFGRVYVAGSTDSADLASTPGVAQPDLAGVTDAFVARFEANGGLSYLTYLGGSSFDVANGITVDADGNAYVVGDTSSGDFPASVGAVQEDLAGLDDAWVAKLGPTGAELAYASYLGGSIGFLSEGANDVAVDGTGHAYVTGRAAGGLPTTDGALQEELVTQRDVFVAKLAPDAMALVYATYLGGSGDEEGMGIAVDAAGQAYVGGRILGADDFPTTPGALQETPVGGSSEGFVAKLAADGASLVYSTLLGGSANDQIFDLALGPEGRAFVVGHTSSANFPATPGAYQEDFAGFLDLFVAALAADGASLAYATYLGGTSLDGVCTAGDVLQLSYAGIAVDAAGRAAIAACTSSTTDFPLAEPLRGPTPSNEGAVSLLDASGATLLFSTYLGGSSSEDGAFDVAASGGRLFVTGATASTDFLTTPGGPAPVAGTEAFVTAISVPEPGTALRVATAGLALAALAGRAAPGPLDHRARRRRRAR